MRMIYRILTTLCVLCISLGVRAHQPDLSSTILVEESNNKWVLQIRAALTAFEYEIENHYGESSYATTEEFKDLVLKHLQENLSILFNETDAVVLQDGQVKLGHETSVAFNVVGTPEAIRSLAVKNSSFGNISRNQSALIVLKKGFSKDQFIIDESNHHTVELKAVDSKFELVTPLQNKTSYLFGAFTATLLVLSIYTLLKKTKASV